MPESESHPHPTDGTETAETTQARKKVVIVENKDALEIEARDAAEANLTASKEELTGIKGKIKKIWKHNLFHEYYRQKEIAKVREQITESKNLYAAETNDQTAHNQAMKTLVDRFSQDHDETVHTEANESKKTLETEGAEGVQRGEIKNLISQYASGRLSEDDFREERVRILSNVTGMDRQEVENEVQHTDNLMEIARQVKDAVEHGERLEDLDLDFDVVVGHAKSGVRTEAQFNSVDRLVEKVKTTRLGRLVNETTLASGVAIAYSLTAGLSKRVAQSKVAAWGTFGATAIVGAGLAGARESQRLEEERRQHFRDMAKGKKFDPDNAPRRKEMEEYRYHTEDAAGLTRNIREGLEGENITQESAMSSLGALADAEARVKLSDLKNVDLVSYSKTTAVEKERLDLDIARAQAKVKLRSLVQAGTVALPGNQSVDEFLDEAVAAKMSGFIENDEGIEQKNRMFRKMKAKKVAKTALKALATGLVVGAAFQEGVSLLRDNQRGITEGMFGGSDRSGTASVTALEKMRMWMAGEKGIAPSSTMAEIHLPEGTVKLPDNLGLAPDPGHAGQFNLMENGQVVASGLEFHNGQLTPHSIDILAGQGADVSIETKSITTYQPTGGNPANYVNQHPGMFTRIQREMWYDNDTSAPVFDKNELKLDWGGGGDGIDANGNYVFNMMRMMPDGSYHKNFSVDAQDALRDGKLKLLVSLSQNTQRHVVEIPLDARGNAVIDPNSDVGKLFFKTVNGKAVFVGKFAEVGQTVGTGKQGFEQFKILATHIGKDQAEIPGEIPVTKEESVNILEFSDPYVEPPPIIPLIGRQPLESTAKGLEVVPGYLYGSSSPESDKASRERFSDTIKNNPEAKLNHYKEAREYLAKQDKEYLKKLESLSESAGPMSSDCKIAVCIPVAGHQEGDNIYSTLENYSKQTIDPRTYELVLLVNRPDSDEQGNPVHPDKTVDEIRRFQADHPKMNIRMMETVLPKEQARMGNIRKMLNDSVLLRHHERGTHVPDLVMVSNDADNKGVAPEYLENYVDKFDANPNTEALLGQLDWDPKSYIRNPLVHVGTRMFQYVEAQLRRKDRKYMTSPGANFAFRSSIYAAVDGYSNGVGIAEDVDLGRRIKLARERSSKHVSVGFAGARVSRIYTSSRRAEKAVKDGLSPVEQWSRGFSAFDDDVRKVKWEEQPGGVDYDDPEQIQRLTGELEGILNRTVNALKGWTGDDRKAFARSLGWLGVKFEFQPDGQIRITDASRLIEGLREYQTEGLEMLDRKTAGTTQAVPRRSGRILDI